MSKFYRDILIVVFLVSAFYAWRSKEPEPQVEAYDEIEEVADEPLRDDYPAVELEEKEPRPTQKMSFESQKAKVAEIETEEKPSKPLKKLDRFEMRELDLPLPTSINELLKNHTEFSEPLLPDDGSTDHREGDRDGDVLTRYIGYFETPEGQFRKLQIYHSTRGFEISMETASGDPESWSDVSGELKLFNFKNDPYGVIIRLPNRRKLYFKFYTEHSIPGYQDPFRTLKGWLILDKKKAFRMIAIDASHYHLADPNYEEGYRWPELKALKPLLLQTLPQKKK